MWCQSKFACGRHLAHHKTVADRTSEDGVAIEDSHVVHTPCKIDVSFGIGKGFGDTGLNPVLGVGTCVAMCLVEVLGVRWK